ncbi:MAG: helix-turn-helix transcriptional regulator [Spirochaetaceae bacterium]|nr:helix-turn-helix transcriptional regulator [Spirochaetaceae bacterium]
MTRGRTLSAAALKQEDSALPRSWLEQINREASHYAKKLFFAVERNKDGQTTNRGRSLSRRETEVLKRLSEGFTREEIARVSAISVNTVKSAIRSVYNKLGAVNRADAVRIATERNIL